MGDPFQPGAGISGDPAPGHLAMPGLGLLVTCDRTGISVRDASHLVLDGRRVIGAVFGLVTYREAVRLVRDLRESDEPPQSAPDTPWIVVVVRADGSLAASSSTMLYAGLFHAIEDAGSDGPRMVLASDPGAVARLMSRPPALDEEFIRGFARLDADETATPYLRISRTPVGRTLLWNPVKNPDRASVVRWFSPGAFVGTPLEGTAAIKGYRDTFDDVVQVLLGRVGPISTELSGGLDSSFLAATLVRGSDPTTRVLALTHRPHPGAQLAPEGRMDPDDSMFAAALTALYPNRFDQQYLVNHALVQPLDAAAEAATASWWPTLNPENQVWLSESARRAGSHGSLGVFTGQWGNASFSFEHNYAKPSPLQQRGWRSTLGGLRSGSTRRASLRAVAGTLQPGPLARWRRNGLLRDSFRMAGIRAAPPEPDDSRLGWLNWMAGAEATAPMGAVNPASSSVLRIDPYRSRRIIELAARITPETWLSGPHDRGFARLVGADRVPDEVRLRTRRGSQAWDSWFVIHDQRDRYLASVDQLAATSLFEGIVDPRKLRRSVLELPWGDPSGRGSWNLFAIDRLLSLSDFVQLTRSRLKDLPDNQQQ